jgi:hypothetical protein
LDDYESVERQFELRAMGYFPVEERLSFFVSVTRVLVSASVPSDHASFAQRRWVNSTGFGFELAERGEHSTYF